ncbi:MAG: hypothetical protein QNL11_11665, partial [Desulfobacterales bacterium]|nr:hypothetical protein [Desulfobacterales bacterium]
MKRKYLFIRLVCLTLFLALFFTAFSYAQDPIETLTLKKSIESATKANLDLKSSKEETAAAVAVKKA